MHNNLKRYSEYQAAMKWAKTNARDDCYPHQFWRVEPIDNALDAHYAVAIRSRKTSEFHHYASGD